MINDTIEELTKILIKQDLKDKEMGSVECLNISKVDLIKICIKVVKMIK